MFDTGDPIIYMKIGAHAQEDLGSIIERKRAEIERAGFAMWGYGGNTCHPTRTVQPFARVVNRPIILCMEPMQSKHFAEPVRAEEFSSDGIGWSPIPQAINVLGSRYALCIGNLDEVDETLNLAATRVAVGNSVGLSGQRYIRGRVDKACLEVIGAAPNEPGAVHHIGLTAKIVEPYAVLLKN